MTGYVIRRLLWLAPVLFFVTLITFVLMHLVPGDPWDTKDRPISPQLREQLESKYGLDEPVWQQFLTFSWNALHGDLGVSFQYQDRSVTEIIREGVEVSAVLGLLSLARGGRGGAAFREALDVFHLSVPYPALRTCRLLVRNRCIQGVKEKGLINLHVNAQSLGHHRSGHGYRYGRGLGAFCLS